MRPLGVTIVACLTLLYGAVLFFIFILFGILAVVGGPYSSETRPQLQPIFYVPLPLSVAAFILSTGMLLRLRYVWHASLAFWMVFILFFVWAYSFMGVWHYMVYLEGGSALLGWYNLLSYARILCLPSPFVYAASCTIYFLTKTPRGYFGAYNHVSLMGILVVGNQFIYSISLVSLADLLK